MELTYNQSLANESCFSGVYINATYEEMLEKFGDDIRMMELKTGRCLDNYCDNKVKHQWILTSGPAGDQVLTIYDWKEERPILKSTKVEWHVGSKRMSKELVIRVLKNDFDFREDQIECE